MCSLKKVSLAPDFGCFFPLLSSCASSSLIADPMGARQSLPAHLEHIARVLLVPAKPVNKSVLQEVLQKMYFRNLKGVFSLSASEFVPKRVWYLPLLLWLWFSFYRLILLFSYRN